MNGFSFWSWFSCTFRFADLEYHEEQLNGFSYWSWYSCIFRSAYLHIESCIESSWRVFHFGPDFHVPPEERKQEKKLGCCNNEVQPVWSKMEMTGMDKILVKNCQETGFPLTYEGNISEFLGTWGKNWKYHSISIRRSKMLAQTLDLGKISFSVLSFWYYHILFYTKCDYQIKKSQF